MNLITITCGIKTHDQQELALANFTDFLTLRGLEPITIGGYKRTIKVLLKQINTPKPTAEQLKGYILNHYKSNFSYSHTVNTALAVERFSEFLGNPLRFGRPRKPKPIVKEVLSEAEITLLVAFTKNVRERAIISLLAYSGIRNLELCNLKVRDIDLTSNAVWVIAGKGKKDGVVSITPDCAKILMNYLEEYPRYNDSPLFTTLRFNNLYQTGDLRKLLRVVAKRAKINKRVYPHLLRHSLATNLLNRGANIFMVQHQLRHSFIETTMIYLKANTARLNSEYQFYAPSYC